MQGSKMLLQKLDSIPILSEFRYVPLDFSISKGTVASMQSRPCLQLPRQ